MTLSTDPARGQYDIARTALEVRLDGADPERLDAAIAEAHGGCPVSKLLTGGTANVTARRMGASDA